MIIASDYGNNETGNYSLKIQKNGNSCPEVIVASPNGGEIVEAGTTFPITWTSTSPSGITSQEIRLSTDGGATFPTVLAAGLAGSVQSYTWPISSGLKTVQGRIRITVTDTSGATVYDDSDNDFIILQNVPKVSRTYEYDELNRLTKITNEDSSTITYKYDAVGNRTALTFKKTNLDLIITAVTGPTTAVPGSTITVGDTTKNQGADTAGASKTKYYWSTNNTYSADDLYLGERSVPPLAPGASNTGTISVTVPDTCTDGKVAFYIIARADADNVNPETNENNNNKAKSMKMGPDLIVSAITAPTTSGAGKTITVNDTTKNNGGCPTTIDTTTKFYLSSNSTWDAGDTYLAERPVPVLPPSGTDTATTPVTIPAGTATGTWYIIAKTDATGAVLETSETNNTKNKSIKIGPDFIVSSITAPTSAARGATITIGDTTKNSGGGSTVVTSTTKLYLSINTTYDAGDKLLVSRTVPVLDANGTSTVSGSVVIPTDGCTNSCYIIAISDANGEVTETNETNNTKYKAITINP
ncbi:MAG: hypothetical protein HY755_08080 [Nitrospirae bacterium]|nr:hypothetical protein [Nitrospirota bacterium]